MTLLLAVALAATSSSSPAVLPRARATATVRIVSGEQVRFAEAERDTPARLRNAELRSSGGTRQPLRLIEFE